MKRNLTIVLTMLMLTAALSAVMPYAKAKADWGSGNGKLGGYGALGDYVDGEGKRVTGPVVNDPEKAADSFNYTLITLLKAAGVIVAIIGVVRFLLAMAEPMPMGKTTAMSMIVLGLLMAGGIDILQTAIESSRGKTPEAQATPVLNIMVKGLMWPGIMMVVIGIIKNITAIMGERPEEKAEAGKIAGAGIAFISLSFIVDGLKLAAFTQEGVAAANGMGGFIIGHVLIPVAIIMGAIIIIFSALKYEEAYKDESASEKSRATLSLTAGVLLVTISPILKMAFGLT